jgi:hypothetical protein
MSGDLNEWVLSLPWVVEKHGGLGGGVRLFGVDCEPLQRRRVWLITGFPETRPGEANVTVAAVMPPCRASGLWWPDERRMRCCHGPPVATSCQHCRCLPVTSS